VSRRDQELGEIKEKGVHVKSKITNLRYRCNDWAKTTSSRKCAPNYSFTL